jgi:hypothetical protein
MYVAELRGIELAFQITLDVYTKTNASGKCTVFTNNQAAILVIANPKSLSEQYILINIIRALDRLQDQG